VKPLLLALVVAAGALSACSGGGAGEPRVVAPGPEPVPESRLDSLPEPWAYCRAEGTVDAPDPARLDPEASAALLGRVREAFDVSELVSEDLMAAWTIWRCMDGQVWACAVGANLPCSERADTERSPSEPIEQFCRDQPNAESVPAVVTGRATVYSWRCVDGRGEAVSQWTTPDARGFHSEIWQQIDPPAG
jgi:hypothetical protein